jgi:GT2 family glycosyltransferase
MKFASFIITFNRPARLAEVLQQTLAQTRPPNMMLVVDNGEPAQSRPVVEKFAAANVHYVTMGDNLGPAGAAAFALRRLVDEGYEWIGWGDDDTPPQAPDVFERLLALPNQVNDRQVGGMGAVGARFNWGTGQLQRLPNNALNGIVDVDSIGSGHQLITHRTVIERVGLPNPNLFFGFYDPEYCLRVRRAGFRLLIDGDLMRIYREKAGRIEYKARQSILPRNTYNNMWRRYYVTRNYIHMMRNTFDRPDLAQREALRAIGRCVMAWGRGPHYGAVFCRNQLRGIWDGYRGHLGRTILPIAKVYTEHGIS